MPTTLEDLIFQRKLVQKKVELSHLCILPLVKHSPKNQYVDPYFLDDIAKLLELDRDRDRDVL